MIVIQCLMVVMESGWHTVRMPSPMPAALFTSVLFSSTVPMKSRCVWSSACRVSASSGRTPRKRSVCSASESHSRSSCTAVRKSSAWQAHRAFFYGSVIVWLRKNVEKSLTVKAAVQPPFWPVWAPAAGASAWWLIGHRLCPSGCWAPEAELWPRLCHRGRSPSGHGPNASEPERCWFSSPVLFGKPVSGKVTSHEWT